MGSRTPVLPCLDSVLRSDIVLSAAGRYVALATPGASRVETYQMMLGRKLRSVPRVTKNCVTLLNFRDCCGADAPAFHIRASALRYPERYRGRAWVLSVRQSPHPGAATCVVAYRGLPVAHNGLVAGLVLRG